MCFGETRSDGRKYTVARQDDKYRAIQTNWSEACKSDCQTGKTEMVQTHVDRLPVQTPAKIALEEATRKVKKKPRGGQKITWPKMMENELKVANISFDFAKQNAQSRPLWRTLTHRIMSECSKGRCD